MMQLADTDTPTSQQPAADAASPYSEDQLAARCMFAKDFDLLDIDHGHFWHKLSWHGVHVEFPSRLHHYEPNLYERQIRDYFVALPVDVLEKAFDRLQDAPAYTVCHGDHCFVLEWDDDVRRFCKALVPATIGSACTQRALCADTIIASFLTAVALSALYDADHIDQLPICVIDIAIGTVLVPRDAAGVRIEVGDASSAWKHGAPANITLQDCYVPSDHMLGADPQETLALELARRLPQDLALNLGIGRAAYEAALDYAQLRVQGGCRIIEHQAIGAKLADIAVRLQVARGAIWQAAWAADNAAAIADGSLPDLPLARMAKVFVAEAVYAATKDAAECFGAMGVMRGSRTISLPPFSRACQM